MFIVTTTDRIDPLTITDKEMLDRWLLRAFQNSIRGDIVSVAINTWVEMHRPHHREIVYKVRELTRVHNEGNRLYYELTLKHGTNGMVLQMYTNQFRKIDEVIGELTRYPHDTKSPTPYLHLPAETPLHQVPEFRLREYIPAFGGQGTSHHERVSALIDVAKIPEIDFVKEASQMKGFTKFIVIADHEMMLLLTVHGEGDKARSYPVGFFSGITKEQILKVFPEWSTS